MAEKNRRWVLAERPEGEPDDSTLRLEETPIPEPGAGEVLLRIEWLSLDPYMRGRMSDAKSYADPVALGEVMEGGTVARVIASNHDGFKEGDLVLSYSGWQDYAVSNGADLRRLAGLDRPSWALGVLGMPGLTAWSGLTQIGKPKQGETLVVAAATGPVGATVGQIAKLLGLRAVGVAGGADKCRYAVEELGFDACIDHRAEGMRKQLAAACPDGIDIYFENVGGKVLEAVLPLINVGARIPVCGLISQYNATALPEGPDKMGWLMGQLLIKQALAQGFIVTTDFAHLYPEFARQMSGWIAEGKIAYREDLVDGLENAPRAFIGLLRGENFGKRVVRVSGER